MCFKRWYNFNWEILRSKAPFYSFKPAPARLKSEFWSPKVNFRLKKNCVLEIAKTCLLGSKDLYHARILAKVVILAMVLLNI